MKPAFTKIVSDHAWEHTGNEDNPKARMLATIVINDIWMHLEAIEVETLFGEQRSADPYWQERLDYYNLGGGADGELETTSIMGRTYALFATPFCA